MALKPMTANTDNPFEQLSEREMQNFTDDRHWPEIQMNF